MGFMYNEQALELFKLDLGIKNNAKDDYFKTRIAAAQKELEEKGVYINCANVEDAMLIADYAAWIYRKRQDDAPLPVNLKLRIKNRVIKRRAKGDENVI